MTKPPADAPYLPIPYENDQVYALRALQRGEALPHQQQAALRYIIEVACGTYDLPYRTSDRDTAFACGRQFVGKQLVKLLNVVKLDGGREQPSPTRPGTDDKRTSRKPAVRRRKPAK